MQGIFIGRGRPASKKVVKETVTTNPAKVFIEATSVFGNEFDGCLTDAPVGDIFFCGPNPHNQRKFYGKLTVAEKNGVRSYKVS